MHFAPLVLAKIAKQNVNLQSQDARLFFSPKQLLKFTRNKHNSCFAKPNLKSSQSKGEIAVCAKPTLKYRSHLKHRAHKLFKPSADLFWLKFAFVWLCNSCEIYVILLGLQLHFMWNLILLYNGNLCEIYVDFILVYNGDLCKIYVDFAVKFILPAWNCLKFGT